MHDREFEKLAVAALAKIWALPLKRKNSTQAADVATFALFAEELLKALCDPAERKGAIHALDCWPREHDFAPTVAEIISEARERAASERQAARPAIRPAPETVAVPIDEQIDRIMRSWIGRKACAEGWATQLVGFVKRHRRPPGLDEIGGERARSLDAKGRIREAAESGTHDGKPVGGALRALAGAILARERRLAERYLGEGAA